MISEKQGMFEENLHMSRPPCCKWKGLHIHKASSNCKNMWYIIKHSDRKTDRQWAKTKLNLWFNWASEKEKNENKEKEQLVECTWLP